MTAQVRLASNVIKGSPGFSIFVPGDLHTINLEDFSAVRYTLATYYIAEEIHKFGALSKATRAFEENKESFIRGPGFLVVV